MFSARAAALQKIMHALAAILHISCGGKMIELKALLAVLTLFALLCSRVEGQIGEDVRTPKDVRQLEHFLENEQLSSLCGWAMERFFETSSESTLRQAIESENTTLSISAKWYELDNGPLNDAARDEAFLTFFAERAGIAAPVDWAASFRNFGVEDYRDSSLDGFTCSHNCDIVSRVDGSWTLTDKSESLQVSPINNEHIGQILDSGCTRFEICHDERWWVLAFVDSHGFEGKGYCYDAVSGDLHLAFEITGGLGDHTMHRWTGADPIVNYKCSIQNGQFILFGGGYRFFSQSVELSTGLTTLRFSSRYWYWRQMIRLNWFLERREELRPVNE